MPRDLDRILKEKRELEQQIGKLIWEFENTHKIVGAVDMDIQLVRNPTIENMDGTIVGVATRSKITLKFES